MVKNGNDRFYELANCMSLAGTMENVSLMVFFSFC